MILEAIFAIYLVVQIFGFFITLLAWMNMDEADDHYIPKVLFVPIYGALNWNCNLTLFGKILAVIADILLMPSHIFCMLIVCLVTGIYKLCVKEKQKEEYE